MQIYFFLERAALNLTINGQTYFATTNFSPDRFFLLLIFLMYALVNIESMMIVEPK